MEYGQMLESLQSLEFVSDHRQADAAAKAVLGILTSRLPEEQAEDLTRRLPDPLTFEKLRSHQEGRLELSREGYVEEVATQFSLDQAQASRLIVAGLHVARMAAGDEVWSRIATALPGEWGELLESV